MGDRHNRDWRSTGGVHYCSCFLLLLSEKKKSGSGDRNAGTEWYDVKG